MGNDGHVYMYGTPNGRQGAAYVSRVLPQDILDTSKYEYYSKGTNGLFSSTPAGWYKNDPGKATPVFGKDGGACGVAKPGNTVSGMSVQYNKELNMMHPWSSSTMGTGTDLYWNLSLWSEHDVMLMRTDRTEV
jgi:hypothetical protein